MPFIPERARYSAEKAATIAHRGEGTGRGATRQLLLPAVPCRVGIIVSGGYERINGVGAGVLPQKILCQWW